MQGRARAPAAGTVLNALATGRGSAFAIDRHTVAVVELDDSGTVAGEVAGAPDADTRLVERCVELVVEAFGDGEGGRVRTESEVPMASGLKSSSAAANATVLATLDALGLAPADDPGADPDATVPTTPPWAAAPDGEAGAPLTRADAARVGVRAARDAGVTVTGAFDDASASMLGGVTVTDNREDAVLDRAERSWDVLVWTPPERAYSADADVSRCERVAPMAALVEELALAGDFERAMTVNGFAFCAALGFSADPLVEALPDAAGVSLSGTGPSVTAVGDADALAAVAAAWNDREGDTWTTTTQTEGARTT